MLERPTPLLVLAVLALALAACSDPAEEPAPCTGPDCGGGSGGSGGAPGCPDHAATSPCHFDGAGDPCGEQLCALSSRRCPDGGRCCVLPLSCSEPVGDWAGGTACETDDVCASGLCLEVAGARSCHRPCTLGRDTDSCPTGQHCEVVALAGGATTTTCLGGTSEAPDPGATVCTRPAQCLPGRTCRILDGELAAAGAAVPLCLPAAAEPDWLVSCAPPAGSGVSPGLHGSAGSAVCADHGLCYEGCREGYSDACTCSWEQLQDGGCRGLFCTGLCGRDQDCPERTRCQALRNADLAFQDPQLVFSICRLPPGQPLDWGCWDELDCCKDGLRNKGDPCCDEMPGGSCANPVVPADRTHCRLVPEGDRYLTVCMLPEGRGAVGASCTGHDGCESGLCVEDPVRGPVCAAPCDLRFDRCPDIEAGTTCCPTPVQLPGAQECVPACRTSCESPAACEP